MAKILLVEDDNNLREIYEARLQAEGYEIVSARDGEEALVVAKSARPDLVISDVMMPKISGFEMLDILRNTEGLQHVKVIMLTALGQSEDQKRADSLGADRYLVKSQVTLEDIVNVSQQLLTEAGAIEAVPAEPTPAPVAAPAAVEAPAPPVAVAAAPAPEPVAEPVAEPAAPPVAAAVPVVAPPDTPTIPLTSAPAEPVADVAATPQMPPTPASTAPDVAAAPATVEAPAPPETQQSQAEEEAAVKEQIEQFVTEQPAAAPAAAEPETTAPEVLTETTTPETPPEPAAPAPDTAQDQLLADAVKDLGGEPAEAEEAVDASDDAPHKKIISPIGDSDENKKSLEELLAEEEAREITTTSGSVIAPAPEPVAEAAPAEAAPETPAPAASTAAPAPKPAPSSTDFDPNSIAL